MTEKKFTKQQSRLTLKRTTQESTKATGIFSNGIESNRILIPREEVVGTRIDYSSPKEVLLVISPIKNPSPSTSSIYLTPSQCASSSSSNYEREMFHEPDDFELAQFHHERDLNCADDWFDDTINYTQSQRQSGFIQHHADYYRFNSQK